MIPPIVVIKDMAIVSWSVSLSLLHVTKTTGQTVAHMCFCFGFCFRLYFNNRKYKAGNECFPTAYFKSNNIKKFKYWFEVALRICPMYEVFTSCHEFTKSNNLKTISFSMPLTKELFFHQ